MSARSRCRPPKRVQLGRSKPSKSESALLCCQAHIRVDHMPRLITDISITKNSKRVTYTLGYLSSCSTRAGGAAEYNRSLLASSDQSRTHSHWQVRSSALRVGKLALDRVNHQLALPSHAWSHVHGQGQERHPFYKDPRYLPGKAVRSRWGRKINESCQDGKHNRRTLPTW